VAKAKTKAGKKKAAPKSAPQRAPRQAPAASAPAQTYPCKVLVKKGSESIPREVKDKAQHDRLIADFGADHVEVLS